MPYDFNEHAYRYACWTAARAASSARYKNAEISGYFGQIELREEVEKLARKEDLDSTYFRKWFEKKVENLRKILPEESDKGKRRKPSFGIAAKLISIYIKTVEVMPTRGESLLSKIAFPPIDSILLKNLIKNYGLSIPSTSWSKMEKEEFMALIDLLQNHNQQAPFWTLEAAWNT